MKIRIAVVALALSLILAMTFLLYQIHPEPSLAASISTRLMAAIVAAFLVFRYREWRIIFLLVMFLLMASRQFLTFLLWAGYIQNTSITKSMTEIPGFAVTILSLLSIIYIGVILSRKNAIIKKQENSLNALYGFLPICAKCKKIRNENGKWTQIESYIAAHSDAQFSHGLCEECLEEMYGGEAWYKKRKNKA